MDSVPEFSASKGKRKRRLRKEGRKEGRSSQALFFFGGVLCLLAVLCTCLPCLPCLPYDTTTPCQCECTVLQVYRIGITQVLVLMLAQHGRKNTRTREPNLVIGAGSTVQLTPLKSLTFPLYSTLLHSTPLLSSPTLTHDTAVAYPDTLPSLYHK